jgi:hypothetical protein
VLANAGDTREQVFFVLMDEHEIIHIPAVAANTQIPFHKMVEIVQIDVCEKLRGEIADGQTAIRLCVKKAF